MFNKLLLIFFFSLLSVGLFGQKKGHSVKTVRVLHPAGITASTQIPESRSLRLHQREEAQKSLVVLKNSSHLLPLSRLDTLKILVISIGMVEEDMMPLMINRYVKADHLTLDPKSKPESIRRYLSKSAYYNLVILAIGEQNPERTPQTKKINFANSSNGAEEPSLTTEEKQLLEQFTSGIKTVFVLFGSPRFLDHWS